MKEIPLNPRAAGLVALIDDEDYPRVACHSWTITDKGYAITTLYSPKRTISLHRFVMNATAGIEVDHRDRSPLNCQKYNLRWATRTENNRNVGKRRDGGSQYKGVYWHKATSKWAAHIRVNKLQRLHLGVFINELAAAHAYDAAARIYHGEFAFTNF